MAPGEYVIDTDDPDPDLTVVIHKRDATIAAWTVTNPDAEERTVAADNPEYAADEPAIVVSFVESGLNKQWPEWQEAAPETPYEGAQEHAVSMIRFHKRGLLYVSRSKSKTSTRTTRQSI